MASSLQPAVSAGERSVAIGAPVRGAMIVTGDNNTVEMRLGPVGAVLAFAFRWDRPRRRRRRDRRHLSPPRFDNHVDRDEQVTALLPVDGSPRLVNIYGAAGIGKTHVLVGALNRSESAMRDGTVYLDGRGQSDDDLLHAVFDELFECRVQRRDLRIERLLSRCRAVVALEDVDLPPDAAQRLVLGAPDCRFLVTSQSRVLFDATPVGLQGLTPEYAAVIAEQELGRSLGPQERRTAEMIAVRLDGHPLALRQAFSRARDEGRGQPLNELEALLGASETPADRLATLTRAQRDAARALAVHGDAPLGDEHLLAIAGAGAVAAARELEARHDATSHSPRHSLVGILAQTLPQADLSEETDRALEHFTGWTEAHAGDSEALLREAAALLALLERAHAAERWPDVIRLGRAIDGAYAVGQRWAAWGRVLELVLDAARRADDLEAEGWARHQLGTRSYGLGKIDAARSALQEALALRERIGDSPGAAATRQNLRVVSGPPPLLYRLSHVSLTLVAIVMALLIGAAGVAGAGIIPGGGESRAAALFVGVQGSGLVVSDDGSVRCANVQCTHQITGDTEFLLRAQPRQGWEFAGWGTACSGRSTCRVVVKGNTHVLALFKRVLEPRDVTVSVHGTGTVVSHPAGIACHAEEQCHATFTRSRTLALTAAAAPGHRFAGWSRDCAGTTRCTIAAGGSHTVVHARFVADPQTVALTVDVGGDGLGRVTSRQSGIDCGELCAGSFPRDTRVVLSASAEPGSRFAGWSDPTCTAVTRSSCTVALDRSRSVIARFARTAQGPGPDPGVFGSGAGDPVPAGPPPNSNELTVDVHGPGTVSSQPAGIGDCSKHCSASFPEGQRIVLTATATKGSTFAVWTDNACADTTRDTCVVMLDRSRDVYVRFDAGPEPPTVGPLKVHIDAPADGSRFTRRQTIRYAATVDDPQNGPLPDDAIVWREDGKVIGRGPEIKPAGTSSGTHKIEVTATSSDQRSARDSISITVNTPPVAGIVTPQDNTEVEATLSYPDGWYADVPFTATAHDPDGDQLTYRWTDSTDDTTSPELSPTLRLRIPATTSSCFARTTHVLRLTVSDGIEKTTTAPVTVEVFRQCESASSRPPPPPAG